MPMALALRQSHGARLRAVCVGVLPVLSLATNRGQPGCPCIGWTGLDNYITQHNGVPRLAVYPSGSGGTRYWYPSNYGTLECRKWDEALPPYCADEDGGQKVDSPDWCHSFWCYVDKATCNLPIVYRSSYFPNDEVYYSYSTCGASNTFISWFASGANESLHSMTELIDVVGGYVKATRDEIESAFLTQQAQGTTACSLTSGCNCAGCMMNSGWGQRVAFTDTMALTTNSIFQCWGMIVSETYKRVAGREYNNASRIGFLYMGWQADGSYMQWPGLDWCPTSYDPRFRDWYAGPAAGPKDIVIVIDKSGSMDSYNRMSLARNAAKAVLKTLTWVDMVAVVAFNDGVVVSSSMLVPATDENRQHLKTFIDALDAGGSTNFKIALDTALDMLNSARGQNCFTANCRGALLFLTDGQPDSWNENDYARVRDKNSGRHVKIFGYALGSGANIAIPRQLAQEHGGEFQAVPDGGNLNNAMASYYKVFADLNVNTDIVRWLLYEDLITKTDLLAGCLPIYDRRNPSIPVLLGVTCMDVNIIADLGTLRRGVGWSDFEAKMEIDSRRCTMNDTGRLLSRSCSASWQSMTSTIASTAVHSFGAVAPSLGILAALLVLATALPM